MTACSTEGTADGVDNEKVFFVGGGNMTDASRVVSIGLDWAPLAHGNDMGPPMD